MTPSHSRLISEFKQNYLADVWVVFVTGKAFEVFSKRKNLSLFFTLEITITIITKMCSFAKQLNHMLTSTCIRKQFHASVLVNLVYCK